MRDCIILLLLASSIAFPLHSVAASPGKKILERIATGEKACDRLTELTGEVHQYAEGILKNFSEAVPPAGSPINRERAPGFLADFIGPDEQVTRFTILTQWKDPQAPYAEMEQEPLSVAMVAGRKYAFCYNRRSILSSSTLYNFIDYKETIRLLE